MFVCLFGEENIIGTFDSTLLFERYMSSTPWKAIARTPIVILL